ncbi:probable serine/threonine-protein kinase dyrk2 isoform X2 [Cydia splendana]|uniref:probable serine/threonine-protein kinase dyrk2 isoform X2 n=1 Tax=Cydia splendana TaxID=1100963 RepID=UPI0028F492FF
MFIRSLLLIQILLIISGGQCAPKLGGILFEQLFLETFMDDENNTNANYKREFTVRVPVYQTNIKNSTSLYAKLTGNSLIKSDKSRSRHKNKELKHLKHNVKTISNNSDFNNSSGINKNKLTTSFPSTFTSTVPLTTVKIKTTYHSYNPEKPNDSKTLKHVEKEKIKLDVNKTAVKQNESQKSSNMPKSRRDGEMLQSNGYAFNGNNCQMKGDRVLCGYNNQELETIELKAADRDCILRGDRIECGYVNRKANNRRNNKENIAVETRSEIKNVTDNLTTSSVTSYTNTTIKTTHATEITKTTNHTSAGNIEDQSDSSKFETQELLEDVKKSIASIITNANTSTTTTSTSSNENDSITKSNISTSTTIIKEQPEIASLKIIELINRVEKLLASADTITTFNVSYPIVASNKSSTFFSTLKEEPTELLNLTIGKSNRNSVSLASTVTLTNSTVNSTVSTTTSSTSTTSTSTTTTSTSTTTTTPVPYIDDGEYCVEKDGRIVCYDSPQEDYDDFLEK